MEQFIILQFGLLFGLLVWFVKDFYPGVKLKSMSMRVNQLEKLEAAKAAWLVCLSLLSLTWPYLALLSFT